ncbi:hypothetical protein [Euzebya pacifica]|jgi:hypothetical protein|uniref:hypothetical protein n=1 Tax=Euzebya pacifica TaxID=1608957 RepID=UPI0030F6D60F
MEFRGWDLAIVASLDAFNAALGTSADKFAGRLAASADGAEFAASPEPARARLSSKGPRFLLTIPLASASLTTSDRLVQLTGAAVEMEVDLALMLPPGALEFVLGILPVDRDHIGSCRIITTEPLDPVSAQVIAALAGTALAAAIGDHGQPVLPLPLASADMPDWLTPRVPGFVRPLEAAPDTHVVVSALTSNRPSPGRDAAYLLPAASPAAVVVAVPGTQVLRVSCPEIEKLLGHPGALAESADGARLDGRSFTTPSGTRVDHAQVTLDSHLNLELRFHRTVKWWVVSGTHGYGHMAMQDYAGTLTIRYGIGAFPVKGSPPFLSTTGDSAPFCTTVVDYHPVGMPNPEGDADNVVASLNHGWFLGYLGRYGQPSPPKVAATFDAGGLRLEFRA